VAITGSSGLVGSALTALLTSGGHRVIRLVRRAPAGDGERRWDPEDPDPGLLHGTSALVHLAGAPIAGRFTTAHKHSIRASRITPTRRLAELAAATPGGPAVMVTASAIGYYGPHRGDELLTEDSPRGHGFLAGVVAGWEAASAPASDAGLRVVCVRTGIVQSPRGGTLRLLWPLAEVGADGRLGAGHQWVSWIGIDDLTDIYYRALTDDTLAGPVNATAPHPVRNADYARILAHVLRRPLQLPVPGLGPRFLLGQEGASELAEADQRVSPRRLLRDGHRFRHPELEPTIRHLLGRAHPGSENSQWSDRLDLTGQAEGVALLARRTIQRRASSQVSVAKDAGFELARGCPQHAFQQCADARRAAYMRLHGAPPGSAAACRTGRSVSRGSGWPPQRRPTSLGCRGGGGISRLAWVPGGPPRTGDVTAGGEVRN